jgi:hypothetical protein
MPKTNWSKKDPADTIREEREFADDLKAVDIGSLKMDDFKSTPREAARINDPFNGYPMKDIVIDGMKTKKTFVVALDPRFTVHQDPNNRGKIRTSHNRIVFDNETKSNADIVFDRKMKVKDGVLYYALVPSHSIRAQLIFFWDAKKMRIAPDDRYRLLDLGQLSRLKQLFQIIINPKLHGERVSALISDEAQGSLEDTPVSDGEITAA